ncbi:hypothetical protein [Mongoliimonas terrestris]|uniref:hypothetical protein n=1 Tax=Mongoliimonas terrestris TaxID=1709001 RepID=UPI00094976C0|nr:hypothetical protein [Mongoliimonas terrestris]
MTPGPAGWVRRAGRSAAALLTVLALGYMAVALVDAWPSLTERGVGADEIGALAGLALVHALALLLLAENWRAGIDLVGGGAVAPPVARRAFTDTQVAKYLPGNVLHLAARHGVLARAGMSHGALVAALVLESLVLVLAAVLVGALALSVAVSAGDLHPAGRADGILATLPAFLDPVPGDGHAVVGGGLMVLLIALTVGALALAGRLPAIPWPPVPARRLLATGLPCLLRAMIFFAVQGTLFAAVLSGLDTSVPASLAVAASAVAWVAGYLTVGAPGGLGPREVVLVALVVGLGGGADTAAAVAAALFRLVTMLGDGFVLAIGRLAFRSGDGGLAAAPR